MPGTCLRCGRTLSPDRGTCLVCGWTPGVPAPPREAGVFAETFRSGAQLPVCAFAMVLFGLPAILLGRELLGRTAPPDGRLGSAALLVGLLMLGPVPFLVQLLRRWRWIRIDPDRGLVTSAGRLVPWEAVLEVEHRRAPFRRSNAGADALRGAGFREAYAIGCFYVLLMFLGWVVLPVLGLLSPWHARVVVRLKSGERLVYRDLENDEHFKHVVNRRLEMR